MIKFKDFLNESSKTIYHGDNYKTTKLDPKLMNNGNNQEGIGIYFGSFETAKNYGKNIISLKINPRNFVDSRKPVKDFIKLKDVSKILYELYKIDEEEMFYFISDWIEITDPSEINKKHIDELAEKISSDEIRNFQVNLANIFGVSNFVKVWNSVLKGIHGTYQKQPDGDTWYAVINDKLKPEIYKGE